MRLTRNVLPALLVATLVSGCGGGGPPGDTTSPGGKDGKPGLPTVNPKETEAGAKKFATEFLAAVKEKKASPAELTADFKKVFAPPALAGEQAQGYSDQVAATELGLLAAEVGAEDIAVVAAADGSAFAIGKNKTGGRTLLRAVKVRADWKADWLSVGPTGVKDATLTGDDAPAQFAAQALLDAVARKKPALASALLTEQARTRLGESKLDKKFDAGALGNKLDELIGGYDGYKVTGTSKDGVTVELPFAAGKKMGTLKAVKGTRPGEWLVDSIEVK